MIIKAFSLGLMSVLTLHVNGQYQTDLDANNIRARFHNTGMFFNDGSVAKFNVPKTSPPDIAKCVIYSSSLWFSGYDESENLLLSAQTFQSLNNDFTSGPINPKTHQPVNDNKFKYIWKDNISDFNDPVKKAEWPAYFYDGPDSFPLAPFVDNNNNRVYEPYEGERPAFGGDQFVYMVYNDLTTVRETGGKPLGIQVEATGIAKSSPLSHINNAIMVYYRITNRSGKDIKRFKTGIFVDFDLGYYDDDKIGTDTSRCMLFAYNGDQNDEGVLDMGLIPQQQA